MQFSNIGFGCYRVDHRVEDHQKALYKALTNGISLIDTSSNYSDGGSEVLVGNVLSDLLRESKIRREDITIVTKGGYIQGQNYKDALKRKEKGNPFNDIVEYGKDLWHCINPDFLEDQINRQMQRLDQSSENGYIDVYLLHNPEYYLGLAQKNNEDVKNAQYEYYARIKKAFEFLENKVNEGVIKNYGISSNTFPSKSDKFDFTSLEKVIEIAKTLGSKNHFKYIQFPFNLIESGAILEKNQKHDSITVLELASENNIHVLVNRPLNAITSKGLVRLADFSVKDFSVGDFDKQMKKVSFMENELLKEKLININLSRDDFAKLEKALSFGRKTEEKWTDFGTIEHLDDVIEHYYVPRINFLFAYFEDNVADKDVSDYFDKYMKEVYKLLNLLSRFYKNKANQRSKYINLIINKKCAEIFKDLSLSQKAILLLNSVEGIKCVLVGARQEKYIDDIVPLLKHEKINNAKDIFMELRDELQKVDYTHAKL
jgi:aryl-alcohol dehydrogenase-like predicted oxidoreductase